MEWINGMSYVHIVALLAVLQFIAFGLLVGGARGRYGVRAPASIGHEQFERIFRVHGNTLEVMVCFLTALFIAAVYWPPPYVAGVGAVYLIGRIVYWRAYVADPSKRSVGFALSMVPVLVLILAGVVGAVRNL
jgi:glutathione S-transferase